MEETEERQQEKKEKKTSIPNFVGKGLFFAHYYFLPAIFILFYSTLVFLWGGYYDQPFYEIPKPLLVFGRSSSYIREHYTPSHKVVLNTQQLITKWVISLVNAVFLGVVVWFCYTFSLGLTRFLFLSKFCSFFIKKIFKFWFFFQNLDVFSIIVCFSEKNQTEIFVFGELPKLC